jgi:hypothetical protein
MSRNFQRLSQLVTTFGPGSMLDLPTRSVMIGGLDRWDMRQGTWSPIDEPRLVELLQRRLTAVGPNGEPPRMPAGMRLSLRTPPLAQDLNANREPAGVPVSVFPTWFVCEKIEHVTIGGRERRRRRLVRWQDLDAGQGRRYFYGDDGKRTEVTPIRFVGACERGHIQDIDWRWVVHGAKACQEPMWLEERGTSADPADTFVVCDCGVDPLSLQQAFAPGRLGKCLGARPWLGREAQEDCDNHLRLLTRTATNTYFPQVVTVISLPSAEDELGQLLAANVDELKEVDSANDIAQAIRFNSRLREALRGWTPEELFVRLQQLRSRAEGDSASAPKLAEFDMLASGDAVIGENRLDARLFAETLPRAAWEADVGIDLSFIQNLVAVYRLREVMCLYGFTRLEAAPTSSDGDLEDIRLAVDGAPIGLNTDWLPAVEQFGEGIFIHVNPDTIADWLRRQSVQQRLDALAGGHTTWSSAKYGARAPDHPGAAYVLLHSLSHALISEIALDCGYPASSLKERVYALTDPTERHRATRCGILIYTATTGSLGTLGGLVATTERFSHILAAALRRLQICSNDPVCADHDPSNRTDDRALHGAACHGCLLIAETSCEMRNVFLDRALLVETMAQEGANFF